MASWEFDTADVSGSSVSATAGSAANTTGTLIADATVTGGALSLDGSGDYLQFGSNLTDLRGLSTMTISAWVNTTDTTTTMRRIVEHEDNIYFWSESGAFRYTTHGTTGGTNGQAISTIAPAAGTWQHVLATYEAGVPAAIYINGVLQGVSVENQAAMPSNVQTFQIGARRSSSGSPTNFWNGQLDDVAIWNEVIDLDQITALAGGGDYASRIVPSESMNLVSGGEMVARWSMDDADTVGGVIADTAGYLPGGPAFDGVATNGGPTAGAAGQFGQAVEFAGGANNADAQYIDYSAYSSLLSTMTEGTLTAWIKPSTTDLQTDVLTILGASDATVGSSEARLFISNGGTFGTGNLVYSVRDNVTTLGTVATTDANLLDGQWHFIALTVDGNDSAILYIDGQALSSGLVPFLDSVPNLNSVALGRNKDNTAGGGQWFYDGLMDEVRLYDKALTGSEIQAAMAVPEPACWLMLLLGIVALPLLRRGRA